MINTPAIDAFVSRTQNNGLEFQEILVVFSSYSKSDFSKLVTLLQSDQIPYEIKRGFLWKWELRMHIPVIGPYNDEEHKRIIGKIFSLTTHIVLDLNYILIR